MTLKELESMSNEILGVIFDRQFCDIRRTIPLDYYIKTCDSKKFEFAERTAFGVHKIFCMKCSKYSLCIIREKEMFACEHCAFGGDILCYVANEKKITIKEAFTYLTSLLDSGKIIKYGSVEY
jgi:hypothetical protein